MTPFKEKLSSLGLGLALALAPLSASAIAIHVTEPMINNGTLLCLSNSTVTVGTITNSGGATNLWYYSYYYGTNVNAGYTPFTVYTNFPTTGVNQTNYLPTVPAPLIGAPLWADANADIAPDVALQIVVGYTNVLFYNKNQTPILYNTVWTNPVAAFAQLYGGAVTNQTGTNLITITLNGVASGDWNIPEAGQSTLKSWSFSFWETNNAVQVITTNISTAFLQGLWGVAPQIQVAATNTALGQVVFDAINLVGWKP